MLCSLKDEMSPYLRDIMRSVGNLTAAQNRLSNQVIGASYWAIQYTSANNRFYNVIYQ